MHCAGGQVLQHDAFLNHAPDLDRASIFYFILFCMQSEDTTLSGAWAGKDLKLPPVGVDLEEPVLQSIMMNEGKSHLQET